MQPLYFPENSIRYPSNEKSSNVSRILPHFFKNWTSECTPKMCRTRVFPGICARIDLVQSHPNFTHNKSSSLRLPSFHHVMKRLYEAMHNTPGDETMSSNLQVTFTWSSHKVPLHGPAMRVHMVTNSSPISLS